MYNIGIVVYNQMESEMHKIGVFICASMLFACSAPPKPPTVDGMARTAVNTTETPYMWYLQTELIEIKQRLRDIEKHISSKTESSKDSRTVTVHFPYNSTRFRLTKIEESELLSLLVNFVRIEVRGRTDSEWPSGGDALIALKRAKAAKKYLVSRGVPSAKVSINYLSGGDHVSEGKTQIDRMKNRRVEIEIFYK